jgi:hypothetical protein
MKNCMIRVAAMGVTGAVALAAFAEEAYIEADGTQAIVTDYYPNPTTKIVADDRASDARDTRLRQRHRVPVPPTGGWQTNVKGGMK